jgi:hypothetical protein
MFLKRMRFSSRKGDPLKCSPQECLQTYHCFRNAQVWVTCMNRFDVDMQKSVSQLSW